MGYVLKAREIKKESIALLLLFYEAIQYMYAFLNI